MGGSEGSKRRWRCGALASEVGLGDDPVVGVLRVDLLELPVLRKHLLRLTSVRSTADSRRPGIDKRPRAEGFLLHLTLPSHPSPWKDQ